MRLEIAICGCENGGEYPCPHCDKHDQDDLDGMSIDEIADALSLHSSQNQAQGE